MELRQLEYFVAVAEEGTFTQGAQRVRVAQSAVSATIQKLERELGVPLFSRAGRNGHPQATALTDAGQALLPEARAVLNSAVRATDIMAQVHGGLRGTVRMGAPVSVGTLQGVEGVLRIDLPAILGRFHVTHPRVAIRLQGATTGSVGQLAEVAAGRLDLAMVCAIERPPGVRLRALGSVRCCFVCSRRHPLAGATSVTLDDLADETFVDYPLGWGNRTLVDRAFARAGIDRDVQFEAADQTGALRLVRNNLGVAFLPRFGSETDETVVIDVVGVDLDLPIALATPADREPSPATRALIEAIVHAV